MGKERESKEKGRERKLISWRKKSDHPWWLPSITHSLFILFSPTFVSSLPGSSHFPLLPKSKTGLGQVDPECPNYSSKPAATEMVQHQFQ